MADCDGDDDVDYLDQGNNNNKSHTTTVCDEDYDKDEPLEKKDAAYYCHAHAQAHTQRVAFVLISTSVRA